MPTGDYDISGSGGFCPVATLAASVGHFATQFSMRDLVADTPEDVYNGMTAMIGDEIVLVTLVGAGFIDVTRGCSDTIPQTHGEGSAIWFYSDEIGGDHKEYSAGETVTVKPLPYLSSGPRLPQESSPPNVITMNYRFARPYPPGHMLQNGSPWFTPSSLSASAPDLTLTWVHRDRILQADQQVNHFEGNIGPEPGTTYIARVFNEQGHLKRTETGLVGNSWIYTWQQAIADLEINTVPLESSDAKSTSAYIEFASLRDNLESWQIYTLPFWVSNAAPVMQLTMMAMTTAQPDEGGDGGEGTDTAQGMFVTTVASQTVQSEGLADNDGGDGLPTAQGIFLTSATENIGQASSFYTTMNRVLFEAPYTHLVRRLGNVPSAGRVVTAVARPSDRLTDSHQIFGRELAETGNVQTEFATKIAPGFTPWLTIATSLHYLSNTVGIRTTSLYDGIPLDSVAPGQLAMIGAEVVTVIALDAQTVTLARGCADTIPAMHGAGARVWFFEAASGLDPTGWTMPPIARAPGKCAPDPGWAHLQYKMVPDVYGPALELSQIPTDSIDMKLRNIRPFPPGQVMVNGKHWYEGVITDPEESVVLTWASRNRVSQGGQPVDHTAPAMPIEPGTVHRLRIKVTIRPTGAECPIDVIVRNDMVAGNRYEYTPAMAYADGHRVARALSIGRDRPVCGSVSIPLALDAVRDGHENWQGYSVLLRLPAPACPPGQSNPGGNTSPPGNGNGDTGTSPNPPVNDPHDNSGGGGWDPGDGGNTGNSGGTDGGGTRPPDPPPPDWPDPVDPGIPGPTDPTNPADPTEPEVPPDPPDGIGFWDYRWDTFWASRGSTYNPGDGGYDPGEG